MEPFADPFNGKRDKRKTPTGFQQLDAGLGGGLSSGLHCLGAVSSLGKSTFALQMADSMALRGCGVIYYSLEMSSGDINAKSISRLMFELNGFGVDSDELQNTGRMRTWNRAKINSYKAAVEKLSGISSHQYIVDKSDAPVSVEEIADNIAEYRQSNSGDMVLFIDYLQFLAKKDMRLTDKQNMDINIMALKLLARKYDIPIVLISSLSRSFYNVPMDMASFKESGIIEYTADTVMGLQYHGIGTQGFDAKRATGKEIRDIELVILKNRFGPSGITVPFEYRTIANHFREEAKTMREPKIF